MGGSFLQAFALGILSQESWYQRPDRRSAPFLEARSPENTVIFLVSLAQLVLLALVFDSRNLYRKVSAHELASLPCMAGSYIGPHRPRRLHQNLFTEYLSVPTFMALVTSELMFLDLNQDTMLKIDTAASGVALSHYDHALLALGGCTAFHSWGHHAICSGSLSWCGSWRHEH